MNEGSQIKIAYGRDGVNFIADRSIARWDIIRPKQEIALSDVSEAFISACLKPIACQPINEIIKSTDRIVIVTSDGTRPVPNKILIPLILKILKISEKNVTILLGNGTHRKNTLAEIEGMFGGEIEKRIKIVNHESSTPADQTFVGRTSSGTDVYLNKHYVETEKRLVLGFIEPHFFAGFSGGAKGVVPAVAGLKTILHLHRSELIAHPKSTWGELSENPIQHEINEIAEMCPPDFLINVMLNSEKEITGFYAGHYREAHKIGCERVKEMSMIPVSKRFPVVITSNSGYPLDQNLYQTVKGISAAARIVEDGGIIFVASECGDGIPLHGNFFKLMKSGSSLDEILRSIASNKKTELDQWQAQILSSILKKSEIALYSSIPNADVIACKLKPIHDLQSAVNERINLLGRGIPVAVLPDGPMTIPYIRY